MTLIGLIKIAPVFAEVTSSAITGAIGWRFTPARNLTIGALGRFAGSIFNDNHDVRLWTDIAELLALVTVTPSSPVDTDGYYYEPHAPIELIAGEFYRIASTEIASTDNWIAGTQPSASLLPPNTLETDFDETQLRACFGFGPVFFPTTASTVNVAFGKQQLYEFIPATITQKRKRRGSGKVRTPGSRRN